MTATTHDRLALATLHRVPPPSRPGYDPAAVGVGQVHLGLGAFHRAHQAVYTDAAIAAGSGDWGVCAVSHRSRAVVDAVTAQDGLYAVVERDGLQEPAVRVVGAVREALPGAAVEEVTRRLADPRVHVVTLTATERAYPRDPATGRLDETGATGVDLAALAAGGRPRTALGRLLAGLAARARADAGPLTVVSCDNLTRNGGVLADLVLAMATRVDPALARWVTESVRFPSTVVDRIVPAPQPADGRDAARALGLADGATVATEPFRLWVIEDSAAGPLPPWQAGGALLVPDTAPYERVKLRVLNATHSALAYLGLLAGHELVADAAGDQLLVDACRRLLTEDVRPTLDPPPGLDPAAYAADALGRFRNPALRHRLTQVAADGSQKLPQRVLGTAADRVAAGAPPRWVALVVAAWLRCLAGTADDGRTVDVADPLAGPVRRALASSGGPAAALRVLGGPGTAALTGLVTDWYRGLADHGVRGILTAEEVVP